MKKKLYIRPLSVTLSEEMFDQIKAITDQEDIALSDYVRAALQEKINKENLNNIKKEE